MGTWLVDVILPGLVALGMILWDILSWLGWG